MQTFEHPNLSKVYSVQNDQANNYTHISLEYLKGYTLMDNIYTTVKLTMKQAKCIIKKVLEAVNYMHQHNVVHGGICPSNIFYDLKNGTEALKLQSFIMSSYIMH